MGELNLQKFFILFSTLGQFIVFPTMLNAQVVKLKDIVASGSNGRITGDFFGRYVANYGDILVIGAIGQDFDKNGTDSIKDAGAAYIFYRNEGGKENWGLVKKIVGVGLNDRIQGDQFGVSVAIHKNIIVVGAQKHDFDENGADSIKDAGAAYVFARDEGGTNNWGFIKKIVGSGINGRLENDEFGYSVSVSQDVIIVGASGQDYDENGATQVNNTGAVFVFLKDAGGLNNWGLVKKLVGSGTNGRERNDGFGVSVSISNNTIVSGAWRQGFDSNGNNKMDQSDADKNFFQNGIEQTDFLGIGPRKVRVLTRYFALGAAIRAEQKGRLEIGQTLSVFNMYSAVLVPRYPGRRNMINKVRRQDRFNPLRRIAGIPRRDLSPLLVNPTQVILRVTVRVSIFHRLNPNTESITITPLYLDIGNNAVGALNRRAIQIRTNGKHTFSFPNQLGVNLVLDGYRIQNNSNTSNVKYRIDEIYQIPNR